MWLLHLLVMGLLASATLVGCGGSGGTSDSPTAHSVPLSPPMTPSPSPSPSVPPTALRIAPGLATLHRDRLQQLIAIATYSDGSERDVTADVQWSSDTPNVASVSDDAGHKGIAIGGDLGAARFTASLGKLSASAARKVVPSHLGFEGGYVTCQAQDAQGRTYVGGSFTSAGTYVGDWVGIDIATGKPFDDLGIKDGWNVGVLDSFPDGLGGWILFGNFAEVQGQPSSNYIHVLADGSLDANWRFEIGGTSFPFACINKTLFVMDNNTLQAVDSLTGKRLGTPLNCTLTSGGVIHALAVSQGLLFVGGQFSTLGNTPIQNLAAIDLATGNVLPWTPNPDQPVQTLAASADESVVYVGGGFSTIAGTSRAGTAAFATNSLALTTWNPQFASGAYVDTIGLTSSHVYLSGSIRVSGTHTLASTLVGVDATTGHSWVWTPPAGSLVDENSVITCLATSDDKLCVAGYGSPPGPLLEIFDTSQGTPLPLLQKHLPRGWIGSVHLQGNTVFLGGSELFLGTPRSSLAALEPDGSLASWNPGVDGRVDALATEDGTVFAAGSFSTLGGQGRIGLGAVDSVTGQATPWNPNAAGAPLAVSALACGDGVIYAAGRFDALGGQVRSNLAALDSTTGQATPWNPSPDGPCFALASQSGVLYVGGHFARVGSQPRSGLAALDPSSGIATGWNPVGDVRDATCTTLTADATHVVAGGVFPDAYNRLNLVAFDTSPTPHPLWKLPVSSPPELGETEALKCLCLHNNTVYVGGAFKFVLGGSDKGFFDAFDVNTGQETSFSNDTNSLAAGPVLTIQTQGHMVCAGGQFDYCYNHYSALLYLPHYASLDMTTGQFARATPTKKQP